MTNFKSIQNRKFQWFFSLALLTTSYLLLATPVNAQALDIGVFPPIIQITATPPTSIKQPITVVNTSDQTESVSVSFRPFTQSPEENGQVSYLPPGSVFGADPDIFAKMQLLDSNNSPMTSMDLAPQEQKTLILHIGLPKDEPPSDYYFSIIFSSNDISIDTNGSGLAGGIATNVLLSVGPQGQTSGFLTQFSSPLFLTNGPVPFTIKVTNASPFFIVPRGQVLVRNLFGQLVGKIDLLPVNILSGTERFIPDSTQASLTTAIWGEKVLFGPYRANIVISLSPNGPIFTRAIYFFAMPYQYLIGAFLAIAIISIVLIRIKKGIKGI